MRILKRKIEIRNGEQRVIRKFLWRPMKKTYWTDDNVLISDWRWLRFSYLHQEYSSASSSKGWRTLSFVACSEYSYKELTKMLQSKDYKDVNLARQIIQDGKEK